jgi:hypothetical protein
MANRLSDARAALKTTLEALGYIVYSAPLENMTPPCLILVPANPYATIATVGATPKMILSLQVTLCVAINDNQGRSNKFGRDDRERVRKPSDGYPRRGLYTTKDRPGRTERSTINRHSIRCHNLRK